MNDWPTAERLYNLLPTHIRARDAEHDETLRALLAVIEAELEIVEGDIDQLYDDWFVETCEPWLLPYIGDLLGVRAISAASGKAQGTMRAYVANTLAYRRRKGTVGVLEQLARDVTGWPSRAVEFWARLSTTQHVNHVRPASHATASLRGATALERVGGPFEGVTHGAEVRRIGTGRGRYNLPNVGLFVWRLQAYPLERAMARPEPPIGEGRFSIHPIGCSQPLFNRPQTETAIESLAEGRNVPEPLSRRALHDDLERLRQAVADGRDPATAREETIYFGDDAVFRLFVGGLEIPPERIAICTLTDWREPEIEREYRPATGGPPVALPLDVALDPRLGRLRFRAAEAPAAVEVSYAYGFSADLGGGPYDRRATLAPRRRARMVIPVAKGTATATLQSALLQWEVAGRPPAIIQIQDNGVYGGNLDVTLPPGGWLTIEAANERQPSVRLVCLTTLRGPEDATLRLDGLLVEGALQLDGDLDVEIVHCTLVPGRRLADDCSPATPDRDSLVVAPGANTPRVTIGWSICGPIRLPPTARGLTVRDSILDAPEVGGALRPAIAANDAGDPACATTLERVTIFGPVAVREMALASEVLFTAPLRAERRQAGCVRFSYVPPGSRTPRRHRCQPDLALEAEAKRLGKALDDLTATERSRVLARLRPRFTSDNFADPAYAQLSALCAAELREGAADGSEMGAFHHLMQPQREANLRGALDEYLRFGLEAGIFYET